MNMEKLAMFRKANNIERLHTVAHHTPYTNGTHSANAALLVRMLGEANYVKPVEMAELILYMLLHDVPESDFGDMPSDAKRRHPALALAMSDAESKWEAKHLPELPQLHGILKDIAKCADLLELYMYCQDELEMGNTKVQFVANNCTTYLLDYGHVHGVQEIINSYEGLV